MAVRQGPPVPVRIIDRRISPNFADHAIYVIGPFNGLAKDDKRLIQCLGRLIVFLAAEQAALFITNKPYGVRLLMAVFIMIPGQFISMLGNHKFLVNNHEPCQHHRQQQDRGQNAF